MVGTQPIRPEPIMTLAVPDLLTFGGLSVAVLIVFELVKRVWQPDATALHRFGPAVAIFLGVVLGGGAALLQGTDVANAVLLGLTVGATASGLYTWVDRATNLTYTPTPPSVTSGSAGEQP